MAETTTPRLMAAAKEFNVGKDTLVDFLLARGFSKDDLKPTSKLSEDMYRSLQQEFQSDKVAKLKSDQIDLPKGAVEARKRKEDEAIVFRKDPKKAAEEAKEQKPEPVKVEPTPPPVVEVKPVPPPTPVPEPKEIKQPEPVKEPENKPEHIKIEAPEVEAPVVLDKIDLSAIDSSTRPKKSSKKKAETPAESEKPEARKPKLRKNPRLRKQQK